MQLIQLEKDKYLDIQIHTNRKYKERKSNRKTGKIYDQTITQKKTITQMANKYIKI